MDSLQKNIVLNKPITGTQPVIEIEHLQKAFGTNVVLRDFNLTINAGENIVVMGKSGIGKRS